MSSDLNKKRFQRPQRRPVLVAVGAALFTAATAIDAPASIAGAVLQSSGAGIRYDAATGTLWNGRLQGVTWRNAALGDVAFHLDPAGLLVGRLAARIEMRGGAILGTGRISVRPFGEYAIHRTEAVVSLSAFRGLKLLGAPLTGKAVLKDADLTGNSRGCRQAKGAVESDALDAVAEKYGRKGFSLKGEIRCENGSLIVPLMGGSEGVRADALVRFDATGRIVSKAAVETKDPDLALALQTLGFRIDNGVWKFESSFGSQGGRT